VSGDQTAVSLGGGQSDSPYWGNVSRSAKWHFASGAPVRVRALVVVHSSGSTMLMEALRQRNDCVMTARTVIRGNDPMEAASSNGSPPTIACSTLSVTALACAVVGDASRRQDTPDHQGRMRKASRFWNPSAQRMQCAARIPRRFLSAMGHGRVDHRTSGLHNGSRVPIRSIQRMPSPGNRYD